MSKVLLHLQNVDDYHLMLLETRLRLALHFLKDYSYLILSLNKLLDEINTMKPSNTRWLQIEKELKDLEELLFQMNKINKNEP